MLQRSFELSRCGRPPPSLHCIRQGHQREAIMTKRSGTDIEQPRVEPEIIPPSDVRSRRAGGSFDGTQRVYVARVGPFGFAIAALAMLLFLLVLGAFVILIPLAGLLLAVIIAVGLFRVLIWRRP